MLSPNLCFNSLLASSAGSSLVPYVPLLAQRERSAISPGFLSARDGRKSWADCSFSVVRGCGSGKMEGEWPRTGGDTEGR